MSDTDCVRIARFDVYDEWGNLLATDPVDLAVMAGDSITVTWKLKVVEDDQGSTAVVTVEPLGPVPLKPSSQPLPKRRHRE